jgi:hypothetical protein
VAIERTTGEGRSIYLNFRMESYFLHRLKPGMTGPARQYLVSLFDRAGVRPLFRVTEPRAQAPFHPVGHDVCVYSSGRGYLVAVRPNPSEMHSEVGGMEDRYEDLPDNVFLAPVQARLEGPRGFWAYDLLDGRALGRTHQIRFESVRHTGRLYAFWPFEIRGLTLRGSATENRMLRLAGTVETSTPAGEESLVVALKAYGPDGKEQPAYRRTIDCTGNRFATELPLAFNETGEWTVQVTEPCTGKRRNVALTPSALHDGSVRLRRPGRGRPRR